MTKPHTCREKHARSLDESIGPQQHRLRSHDASALAAFRLIASSNFGVRSECDRQLLATAAAKLVAEHRGKILELLNRP